MYIGCAAFPLHRWFVPRSILSLQAAVPRESWWGAQECPMIRRFLGAILIGFIFLWGEHNFLRMCCLLVGFWNGAQIVLRSFSPRSSWSSMKEKATSSSSLSVTHLFWLVLSLFLFFFSCFHDLSVSLISFKPCRAYGSISKPSNRDLLGSSQKGNVQATIPGGVTLPALSLLRCAAGAPLSALLFDSSIKASWLFQLVIVIPVSCGQVDTRYLYRLPLSLHS